MKVHWKCRTVLICVTPQSDKLQHLGLSAGMSLCIFKKFSITISERTYSPSTPTCRTSTHYALWVHFFSWFLCTFWTSLVLSTVYVLSLSTYSNCPQNCKLLITMFPVEHKKQLCHSFLIQPYLLFAIHPLMMTTITSCSFIITANNYVQKASEWLLTLCYSHTCFNICASVA